jgi:hypothetical protein
MRPVFKRARVNPLPAWQRAVIVGAAIALLVSGLAWLPLHYLWGAGAGELPQPLESWLLRLHGLVAPLGLFAAGLVAAGHVPRGWRLRERRGSGVGLLILGCLVIASGYALAYLVPEAWHPAVGWAHAALGVVAFALGVVHRRTAQRIRKRAGPRSVSRAVDRGSRTELEAR